jgi:CrcB protein
MAYLLGALFAALAARLPDARWPRPFLAVGALGGYTTYSTFALEVVELGRAGAPGAAAGYVLVSLAGGVVAVAAGSLAAHAFLGRTER